MPELAAQESGRPRECLDRGFGTFAAGKVCEAHRRVRQIRRHVDAGDRHRADARILDLVGEQVRDFALNLVADAVRALRRALHSVLLTSTIS